MRKESIARRVYRRREQACGDVFDYIERFSNARGRHSTLGYVIPIQFKKYSRSLGGVHRTGGSPECNTHSLVGRSGRLRRRDKY
jgi:hypothetical protein